MGDDFSILTNSLDRKMSGVQLSGQQQHIAMPREMLTRWQRITTLIAKMMDVPACFVVRELNEQLKVVSGSENGAEEEIGSSNSMGQGFYCETVITDDESLYVPDAEADPRWKDNPDFVNEGMRGYYGLPVHWPDGSSFGTFCVFSDERLELADDHRHLMELLRDTLHDNLKQIFFQQTLESQNEFLQVLSQTDGLTGVLNRGAFIDAGFAELSRCLRMKVPYSLVMLDVDHFKTINDNFGHAAGDAILQWLCRHVKKHLRDTDVLGRLGGEEFGIHFPNTNQDEALVIASRIVADVNAAPHIWNDSQIPITVSIGIYEGFSGYDENVVVDDALFGNILRLADQALCRAKDNGRNRAEF